MAGDAGYPLQPWLMTPITDAEENTPESRYTAAHIAARNCIERCFGVLKQRFRCLLKHRTLHYSPVRAGKIIKACAVLHNMAIRHCLAVEYEGDIENDMERNENRAAVQGSIFEWCIFVCLNKLPDCRCSTAYSTRRTSCAA